jgi:ABC-type transport system involved in cytochrome bd biosynthesis fused ATPase/permease subunit
LLLSYDSAVYKNYKTVKSLLGVSSYASSNDTLFPLSIYENIILGNERIKREECYAMLHKLGFGEWIDSLPKGIDTVLKSNELSGGQQQMIINVRALLSEFPIVVLDEPLPRLVLELIPAGSAAIPRKRVPRPAILSGILISFGL